MSDNGVMKYLISDHLALPECFARSTVAITDNTGNVLAESRYMPFGEPRADVGSLDGTDKTFTGQRDIPDTGLMDYRARHYSPGLGRFIQPDTIVPYANNSQMWNRYTYVGNNSINYIDPSGHRCLPEDECDTPQGDIREKEWLNPVEPMVVGGGYRFNSEHRAIDLNPDNPKTNPNPDIVASTFGIVYSSSSCTKEPCIGDDVFTNDGYGNTIIIGYSYSSLPDRIKSKVPYGNSLFILYAHLLDPPELLPGDAVKPGQIIGKVGNSGNSFGEHLHMVIKTAVANELPFEQFVNKAKLEFTKTYYIWHSSRMKIENPNNFFVITN